MKKALLLIVIGLLNMNFLFAESILAGRGSQIDSSLWFINKTKVSEKITLQDKGEAFSSIKLDKNIIIVGGAHDNKGVVWTYNKKDETIKEEILPESRVVYTMFKNENMLYAAGIHDYMGGAVWLKELNGEWKSIGTPYDSTMISCLTVQGDKLFAGGFAKADGKVWTYSEGKWNKGVTLNSSKEINCLVKTKETIFAGGLKKDHKGGVWTFNGSSWLEAENIKFSHGIYAGTADKNDVVYLAGAGEDHRILWENSKGFWNAVQFPDALALYSVGTDKKGNIYVGGWNNKRQGEAWFNKKGKGEWKAVGMENCFVVRSIN